MTVATSLADQAQNRTILEQVAKTAIAEYAAEHREAPEARIPSPLRWAGGIVAALFVLGVGSMAVWLVASVSSMQVTLARLDERLANATLAQDGRFTDMERRVAKLEAREDGK